MSTRRSHRTLVDPPRISERDVRSIPHGGVVHPPSSPRRCAISDADETDFSTQLRLRVAEAQASLLEGRDSGDDYLVQLSLGQIESFARLADDNQIRLDGVEETLAPYRGA